MPELIENISIRVADNGFIVSAHGTTGSGESKTFESEEFVFLDVDEASKKLTELMKKM